MRVKILIIPFLLSFLGCSTVQGRGNDRGSTEHRFVQMLESDSSRIWSKNLSQKTRDAISDFSSRKALENGEIYGDSVRQTQLENLCLSQIEAIMFRLHCSRRESVVQDVQTKKPVLTPEGRVVPMIIFLCPDGGAVRVKPGGDPTSRFRPQPHASKALRYPYNSKYETFDDEIVKVDHSGKAIPKWKNDLNMEGVDPEHLAEFLKDWADDAHADLKTNCN